MQSMYSIRNLFCLRCRGGIKRNPSAIKYVARALVVAAFLCLSVWGTVTRVAYQPDDRFSWLRHNRDVRRFLRPDESTSLLHPSLNCKPGLRLLLLVTSAPGNAAQRQAVRDTWGYVAAPLRTRLLFFLGHDGKDPPHSTTEVMLEAQRYGDIIVEDFVDNYYNLTLKTLFMLKWTLQHCDTASFILKTDDDMLINVKALLQHLEDSSFRASQPLIIGRIQEGAPPYRDTSSKWYLPYWLYERTTFPTFASGTGYIITRGAVSEVYKTCLVTPFLPLEDVFVTGLVGNEKLGIPMINTQQFRNDKPHYIEHPCLFHHLLMAHELTPVQLKRIWTSLKSLKPATCHSLYAHLLAYIFGTGEYEVIANVTW
ncbi:beta-1,3-galactosyltransferase 1-like [Periplaneta americana]|uniref:beta-1,3-galactosyltransferase 1-like n=1 Tax=Periplaneta americana TaxID=6978 RepID=UPI0037E7E973